MDVLYEDNHIIIVYKEPGEIVQGDKSGDKPLADIVKEYLKDKYAKPGNVFLGVVHRIDRPVAGLVIFAKTSKALGRLNEMLRTGGISKTYRAIVEGCPEKPVARLKGYLTSMEARNKSYVTDAPSGRPGEKEALLEYTTLATGEKYSLLEVKLLTGRKHQIRAQLSHAGCPIRGDIKYGARRSNPDGSISLLAYRICFVHPVSKETIDITAPLPNDPLWRKIRTVPRTKTMGIKER